MKYQVSFRAKTWYLHMWKETCYLHMWKYHRCYGFKINCTFHTKKNYLSKVVWYFMGVYIINRTLHGRLEIRNFCFRVEKIFHSFAIFFNTSNTTSPSGHVISSNSFSELALQSHHLLISVYLLLERGTNDIYLSIAGDKRSTQS